VSTEYVVTWQIVVDADSPREAAEAAHRIMLDADSQATVFEIRSFANGTEVNDTVTVDLLS
jgi:hypothetical protein